LSIKRTIRRRYKMGFRNPEHDTDEDREKIKKSARKEARVERGSRLDEDYRAVHNQRGQGEKQ
jgi:hypothetical protein